MPRTVTLPLFAFLLAPGAAARAFGHELLEPGFVSLFDGKDIGRHFVIKGTPQTWQVADGVIRSVPGGDRAMSKEEYGDFILRLDWRVSELGNSGVFLRVPSAEDGSPWVSGFEVQITGGRADGGPGERDDAHCAGSLYGVVPVKPRPNENRNFPEFES